MDPHISSMNGTGITPSNLNGSGYRFQWENDKNYTWVLEGCESIATREGTYHLFDRLLTAGEVVVSPKRSPSNQNVVLPEYDYGQDCKRRQGKLVLSLLLAQLELASHATVEFPFFKLLARRILILKRAYYALKENVHSKALNNTVTGNIQDQRSASRSCDTKAFHDKLGAPDDVKSRGHDGVIELGVKTGLCLLFSILKLNCSSNAAQANLCADVLKTALDVVWKLPPKSLSTSSKMSHLSNEGLEVTSKFLRDIVSPTSGATLEISTLGAELLLALSLQRASLQSILEWIQMALHISEQNGSIELETSTLIPTLQSLLSISPDAAVHKIHYDDAKPLETKIDLYKFSMVLLRNIVSGCGPREANRVKISREGLKPILKKTARESGSVDSLKFEVFPSSKNFEPVGEARHPKKKLFLDGSVRVIVDKNCVVEPYWINLKAETLDILRKLLENYGLDYSNLRKPFVTTSEHQEFVILVVKLLNYHFVVINQTAMKVSPEFEKVFEELRNLFFRILEMDLPHEIHVAVSDTLLTASRVILNHTNVNLRLLLQMLSDVKNLSDGKKLLCNVLISSCEDENVMINMLGMSLPPGTPDKKIILSSTKNLMNSAISILTSEVEERLDLICSKPTEDSMQPMNTFIQRLHDLLYGVQTHALSYSIFCEKLDSKLGSEIWLVLRDHICDLIEKVVYIYSRASQILNDYPSTALKIAGLLYVTIGGTMMSRILTSLLIPLKRIPEVPALLLIKLLFAMEKVSKSVPKSELENYECCEYLGLEDPSNGTSLDQEGPWIWFFDMQRTCSYLIGCQMGDLIHGGSLSEYEKRSKLWLNNKLFSGGAEAPIAQCKPILEKICTIFLTPVVDLDLPLLALCEEIEKPELKDLLRLVTRARYDDDSSEDSGWMNGNVSCLYDLMFEHANSLDWDTNASAEDFFLDSVSRLMLITLIKHTGLLNNILNQTLTELRNNQFLNEIFHDVFLVRRNLMVLRRKELQYAAAAKEGNRATEECFVRNVDENDNRNAGRHFTEEYINERPQENAGRHPRARHQTSSTLHCLEVLEGSSGSSEGPQNQPIAVSVESSSRSTVSLDPEIITLEDVHSQPPHSEEASESVGVEEVEAEQQTINQELSTCEASVLSHVGFIENQETYTEPKLSKFPSLSKFGADKCPSYQMSCDTLIRRCVFLLCMIRSSFDFVSVHRFLSNEDPESYDYPGAAPFLIDDRGVKIGSNAANTVHGYTPCGSRNITKEEYIEIARKRVKDIAISFVSLDIFNPEKSSDDHFSHSNSNNYLRIRAVEGWFNESDALFMCIKIQQERADKRIRALKVIADLIKNPAVFISDLDESKKHMKFEADFLFGVYEYFMAGCFQLGLSAPINIFEDSGIDISDVNFQLCHYLDGMRGATYDQQMQVTEIVHVIMKWKISLFQSSIKVKNEVKLLSLFSLSCRFKPNDIEWLNECDLLSVLQPYCICGSNGDLPCTNTKKETTSFLCLTQSKEISLEDCVAIASVRLLHMVSVSIAMYTNRLNEEVIHNVTNILLDRVVSLLKTVSSGKITEKNLCTTAVQKGCLNSQMLSSARQHQIESEVADLFVFLRQMIFRSNMADYFHIKPWINLLLSFMSLKPDYSVHEHYNCSERSHSGNEDQALCRSIVSSPELRPRLLGLQLLQSMLVRLNGKGDSMKELAANELLTQLGQSMWEVPIYQRAKMNILEQKNLCQDFETSSVTRDQVPLTFDADKIKNCSIENGNLLTHERGGRGFGVANTGFSSGCHTWRFSILHENKGNEGTCIGVCKWPIIDQNHRTSRDMWIYRAHSGNLYHQGEMSVTLPKFTQGDFVTIVLDIDRGTLKFGKNGEDPLLAFQNIEATELFPFVLFYSINPGEKVKITDLERERSQTLIPGMPHSAPLGAALAAMYSQVLLELHSSEKWTSVINGLLMHRVKSGTKILEKLLRLIGTKSFMEENHYSYDSGSDRNKTVGILVEELNAAVWPVLCVIGGIDGGLRIGGRCVHKSIGRSAVFLGAIKHGKGQARIHWEDSDFGTSMAMISDLEPIPGSKFNSEDFPYFDADFLAFLVTLSGIIDKLDQVGFSSSVGNEKLETMENSKKDIEKEITVSFQVEGEATQRTLWSELPVDDKVSAGSAGSSSDHTASSTSKMAVEALSSQMVSQIIHEVTRRSSRDAQGLSHNSQKETYGKNYECEAIFLKLAYLQLGALKSLKIFLSSRNFSEYLIAPKNIPKKTKDRKTKGEKKDEDKVTSKRNLKELCFKPKNCTNCGKELPPDLPECSNCEIAGKFAKTLRTTFQHLLEVSVSPCNMAPLYTISEIERIHSVIHCLHSEEVVDVNGQTLIQCAVDSGDKSKTKGNTETNRALERPRSGMGSMQLPIRSQETSISQDDSHIDFRQDRHNTAAQRRYSSTINSIWNDWSTMFAASINFHRQTNTPASNLPRTVIPPRRPNNTRLPSALLEMGFSPRHIHRALNALGLSGELSVPAVSQLASWMLENPSIESEEISGERSRLDYEPIVAYGNGRTSSAGDENSTANDTSLPLHSSRTESSSRLETGGAGSSATASRHAEFFSEDFRCYMNRLLTSALISEENILNRVQRADAILSSVRSTQEPNSSLIQIPIVCINTQDGERGLCCFCSNMERDITVHFPSRHQGCGAQFSNGYCGEVRGSSFYILCEECYDEQGGHIFRRSMANSETSITLPPLTMAPHNGNDNPDHSAEPAIPTIHFIRTSTDTEKGSRFGGILPYLGLKERKPYPCCIRMDEADCLGQNYVDKILLTEDSNTNDEVINPMILQQLKSLQHNSPRRFSALKNTAAATKVILSRIIVMKMLSLLNLGENESDMVEASIKIGLCDVRKLVRFMCLVPSGRVPVEEASIQYNRSCDRNINPLISTLGTNDTEKWKSLQSVGRAIEIACCQDLDSAQLVMEMCRKELMSTAVGFTRSSSISQNGLVVTEPNIAIVLSLVNRFSGQPSALVCRRVEIPRSPLTPLSPTDTSLDPSLHLIDTISACILSNRLSGDMRQWAVEQLVKCLNTRASVCRVLNPDLLNISDISGVLPKCPTADITGHESVITCLVPRPIKSQFATCGYDGAIRVWSTPSCGKHAELESILMFQRSLKLCDLKGEKICNLCWSANGKYIAASLSSYINIWTLGGTDCYSDIHQTVITCLCWQDRKEEDLKYSTDSTNLYVGRLNGTVSAINIISTLGSLTLKREELFPSSPFSSRVTFLENRKGVLATGHDNGYLSLFDTNTRKQIYGDFAHKGAYIELKFSPGGDMIATCGVDSFCRIWVSTDGQWICWKEMELMREPSAMNWSPYVSPKNCFLLAIGFTDGIVSIFLVRGNVEASRDKNAINLPLQMAQEIRCHSLYPVTSIAIHPSGTFMATGCFKSNGVINFWAIDHGILVNTYCGSGGVSQLSWLDDNSLGACFTRAKDAKVLFFNEERLQKMLVLAKSRLSLQYQGLNCLHQLATLKHLLTYLPKMLQEQFLLEKATVNNGETLLHSKYLRSLATLTFQLKLDKVMCCVPIPPNSDEKIYRKEWSWLRNLALTVKTAESLLYRSKLPTSFLEKYRIDSEGLQKSLISGNVEDWSYEDDAQLVNWSTERPQDWQFGGKDVYMFGSGIHGQLGEIEYFDRLVGTPMLCSSLSGSVKVACGQACSFFLHANGSLYSAGEGSYGKLGHGNSEDIHTPTVISALQGYVITSMCTSCSVDGHTLAVGEGGEVWSWGDGDDGKLGHGTYDRQRRPKQIESLKSEIIVEASCGSNHSAVVTVEGALYVFGGCENGQLGLGKTNSRTLPQKVLALTNHKIGFVYCGKECTFCVTEDLKTVFAFGENEYGKLGIGTTCSINIPAQIEDLEGLEIVHIACGDEYTLFLTKNGKLYSCGVDDYNGHGVSFFTRPSQIMSLSDKVIISIAAGPENALCVTDDGEVYAWGENNQGQLGLGISFAISVPTKIKSLTGKDIQQVAVGATHCAAWTAPHVPAGLNFYSGVNLLLGTPSKVPTLYGRFDNVQLHALRSRLKILLSFSDLLFTSWSFLPLISPIGKPRDVIADNFYSPTHSKLRKSLTPRIYNLPFTKTLHRTMVQSRTYGPQITVRRIGLGTKKNRSIFWQICKQVVNLPSADLRLPARAWKVKLIGEGADDAGGVFDELITEICIELTDGTLPYLIPTPNSVNDVGYNRDRYLVNPELTSYDDLISFKFIGILMGVAIRTKKPIAMPLASLIWKILAGEEPAVEDLEEADALYVQGLKSIKDQSGSEFNEDNFHEIIPLECYEATNSLGKLTQIVPGGKRIALTFDSRLDYVEKAISFRLHEMDLQIAAIREGMSGIVPVPLTCLMTGSRLEQLICGLPNISIPILKQIVRYREVDEKQEQVQWLWNILESFNNSERVLFMRFVSGRSRLPATLADFSQRFQVMKVDRPINGLPTAQTCFFQLRLPPYTSREIMEERLRYAINNCTCIDMDHYMLARNGTINPDEDDDNNDD